MSDIAQAACANGDILSGDTAGGQIVDCIGTQHELRSVESSGVFQLAIDTERQGARRGDSAGIANAESVGRTDQPDFSGIHATQCGDVQRESRCGLRARIANRTREMDAEVVRPESRVDGNGLREQGHGIDTASIQTLAFEAKFAYTGGKARQTGPLKLGCASDQLNTRCLNEAATLTGDACRIGNHQFCFATGDFDIAPQLTRITALDFIQNDARAAAGHVGIGRNPATGFGQRGFAAVVNDRAVGIDIELPEAVAGYPGRRWCGDIDLR